MPQQAKKRLSFRTEPLLQHNSLFLLKLCDPISFYRTFYRIQNTGICYRSAAFINQQISVSIKFQCRTQISSLIMLIPAIDKDRIGSCGLRIFLYPCQCLRNALCNLCGRSFSRILPIIISRPAYSGFNTRKLISAGRCQWYTLNLLFIRSIALIITIILLQKLRKAITVRRPRN